MKKIIYFVLFWSLHGYGQDYISFPDSNAVWVNTIYEYSFEDPFPTPYLVDVNYYCVNGEDTLIDAEVYTKLNLCSGAYIGAIRDNGGQVFIVPKDSLTPYLLYDFTVEAGDVLPAVYYLESVSELTVSDVDSVLINATYRTRVNFGGSAFWIEGIGNTFGLLSEPWDNISGYMSQLYCMHWLDTTYIREGNIEFIPGATCPFDVSVPEEENDVIRNEVYPNPSTGLFTLETNFEIKPNQLVLTDLSGKIIDGGYEISPNQITINLENVKPGIYFLTLYTGDQFHQFRLIKT